MIHGMVDRPLTFTMEELKRLPSVTRLHFIECAGNRHNGKQRNVQDTHGMTSCSEWTGVLMSTLAPAGPARAAAVVASAALTGLAGVALAEGALGILPGPWAANAAALGATVLAIASIVGGLTGLLGQAGIGIATALMVFVGNPWSGMTSARELLPEPAATIGALLPPGAGGALLRSTAFFGGARAGGQITVLAVWIAAGLGLIAVAARRHRRTGSPAPADDPLAPG